MDANILFSLIGLAGLLFGASMVSAVSKAAKEIEELKSELDALKAEREAAYEAEFEAKRIEAAAIRLLETGAYKPKRRVGLGDDGELFEIDGSDDATRRGD
jgi:hypothetical protein